MKKSFPFFSLFALCAFSALAAEDTIAEKPAEKIAEPTQDTVAVAPDITKISEAFGHVIGKNLATIGVKFDVAKVIKGLEDALSGKESPMTEMECIQAIATAQEIVFKQQCSENLKRAEAFLSDNAKVSGVVAIEEGKFSIKSQKKELDLQSNPISPLLLNTAVLT